MLVFSMLIRIHLSRRLWTALDESFPKPSRYLDLDQIWKIYNDYERHLNEVFKVIHCSNFPIYGYSRTSRRPSATDKTCVHESSSSSSNPTVSIYKKISVLDFWCIEENSSRMMKILKPMTGYPTHAHWKGHCSIV